MAAKAESGILFPADASGKRSTLAAGKAVFAAAARAADPALADAILAEKNWRSKYEKYVVRLVEVAATSPKAAIDVAEAGIHEVYTTFSFARDGCHGSIADAMAQPSTTGMLSTATVKGDKPPAMALAVPYEGKKLESDALLAQVKVWSEAGCMEPGVEAAITAVVRSGAPLPDLSKHTFVVLGATSALGPLPLLLAWGATVVGVSRKKAANWADLIALARNSAGTLIFPVTGGAPPADASDAVLAQAAGADLMTDAPEILAWLRTVLAASSAPATVGMYTYLDSDAHVRVSIACDAIMSALATPGGTTSLAYIQTPSLAYDVPQVAIDAAKANYKKAFLSLLGYTPNTRQPVAGTSPPRYVHDGFMNLQGPNYALAKMLQMWRAMLARSRDGLLVSANLAPAARTASMVAGDNKNARTIAAGLNGMGYFPPNQCFDQETVAACMAGLLAHDLSHASSPASPAMALAHPHDLFSIQAFHGGTFRHGIRPGEMGKLFFVAGRLLGPASAL